MRSLIVAAWMTGLAIGVPASSASAGGWSGDDSSILRAHLMQGRTLTRIWSHINDR